MKQTGTIVFISMVYFLCACRHKPTEPLPREVCFESEIYPLLLTHCTNTGCHNPVDKKAGYDFTNYTGITAGIVPYKPMESKIFRVISFREEKIMPPPSYTPLNNEQIRTIYEWIAGGAKNVKGCDTTSKTCDTTNISFSTDIQPILNTHCVGCHSSSFAAAGINLDNYTGVKAVVDNGKLYGSITHANGYSPMPKNGNKLDSCSILKVEAWINMGSPNN